MKTCGLSRTSALPSLICTECSFQFGAEGCLETRTPTVPPTLFSTRMKANWFERLNTICIPKVMVSSSSSTRNISVRISVSEGEEACCLLWIGHHIFCSINHCVEINICKAWTRAPAPPPRIPPPIWFWDAKWGSRSSVFPSSQITFSSHTWKEEATVVVLLRIKYDKEKKPA